MSKKILLLPVNGFGIDGISQFIYCLILRSSGSDVSFDLFVNGERDSRNVLELKYDEIRNKGTNMYFSRRKSIFKYVKALKEVIKSNHYDAVYLHGSSSLVFYECFLLRLIGFKNIYCHSHNTTCNHRFLHYIFRPFTNLVVKRKFACSRPAGMWMYGKRKFEVINNGVDVEKFKYSEVLRDKMLNEFSLPKDAVVIGHVGAFNEQKNHKFIIEIAKKLKSEENIYFLLIGGGPNYPLIESQIKEYNLNNVRLLGIRNDINNVINAFDMAILPSLHEGLPIVCVEWLSNGLKILCSDKISNDVDLCSSITFLPLEVNEWCAAIKEIIQLKAYQRDETFSQILREKNFDSIQSINHLFSLLIKEEK
ncbi:MAG: glycosyltransferase [Bacilli bacterium]|nr:glycosyltransferase [Bacilli bacterium]